MSGHSHYATIKRQKGLKDAQKGNVFSKLGRAITIAAKEGGGPDPDSNFKLRVAVEKARQANMPKENIERAISKASGGEVLEEVFYEGFGPGGVGVIVEVATDNRNRTGQEIKNLFEKAGGRLGGPGSVSFNFEPKGLILVRKQKNLESQILTLIDLGAEDVEETENDVEVYVSPEKLASVRKVVEEKGFEVTSSELIQKPKNFVTVSSSEEAKKTISFLDNFNDHDDVQKVFANLDVPKDLI
ncbi:hypothetical protein A2627_02610 [Candidatus Woesebacteria bacterium RIFCSPHIGHO2_01_FULL_39_28]|uniref:Probable transcriptional regulatory protein A2627_02610 n=1 Tax=Candidatus Woesebacteria bacterium RIFCSPHIGHO2_01_FULL_39_28 TaxID=1802496 RepID=A0A1F7YBG1_9BACT|nr:MAG: hypothetical protein A2627_02610 [Candidatus Woesebacteria bacterium RIFCSPHIGHO2_01_FULL_39_28]OGM58394.1 MAG: hypothetical protein A3A50_02535 [Candidatus Woesebacteria bacterium RIFCSPLOWO2_01_FULL_38_20]